MIENVTYGREITCVVTDVFGNTYPCYFSIHVTDAVTEHSSFDDAQPLTLGEPAELTIMNPGDEAYFSFMPLEYGMYNLQ